MGHHVRHARILVVADARQHGERELGDVGAETVGVEAVEVAGRAAAPDEDHGVELPDALGHGAERRDDGLLGGIALHEGVEELRAEGIGTLRQLLAEVLIAGSVGARDHRDALHDRGQRRFAVHLPDPLALQAGDGLLTLTLHVAQRVGGVDVGDLERKAVEFVVGDRRAGQDADAGSELAAGLRLEVGGHARIGRTPDDGPRLGQRHAVVTPFLDQFEVAVARVVDLQFGDFGADPERQRELLVKALLHESLQLHEGDMGR